MGPNYGFLVDDDARIYPDPRSAWQPNGVHGFSRVYDQSKFVWGDAQFQAPPLSGGIVYELHVGTFTSLGTFDAAIEKLDYLVQLGVTHVELMPVAAFEGRHGWGYDGVALFAVHEPYGGPDGLKRFVNAAHAKGPGRAAGCGLQPLWPFRQLHREVWPLRDRFPSHAVGRRGKS